ncbi:hypothetical protein [Blastopirellula marina]|nr:hypothetical protein [Blastopirellula marina]
MIQPSQATQMAITPSDSHATAILCEVVKLASAERWFSPRPPGDA